MIFVAVDKPQGVVGEDIVGVAIDLLIFAIHLECGADDLVAAGAETHEIIETGLGGVKLVRHTQMPFTHQPRPIAGGLHGLGPGHGFRVQAQVGFIARMNPVRDAQLASVTAGHQAGARWATNGGDDVRFLEPHALLKQLVEMGCVGVWMPRKAERPGCLIVRQDEHHIGFLNLGTFG